MKSCYQHCSLICTSRSTATDYNLYELWFFCMQLVSLIKFIFYVKNKKAVDLKLQDRIRRNNSFIRYLSPDNEAIFVRYCLSSRPKVFCKKGGLRNFSKFTGKPLYWSVSLIKLQAWGLQLYYKGNPMNFAKFSRTPDYLCNTKFMRTAASGITENRPCLAGCKFFYALQNQL